MGEIAGRSDRRRASAVGRRARLLVDDRRAHAQVRRVGRRLRRGPPGRPRRRRLHGLVRPGRDAPSACSPTSATRTTRPAASWSRRARRCRERSSRRPRPACARASSSPRATRRRSSARACARSPPRRASAATSTRSLLVLDRCTDATEARARAAAGALRLHVLHADRRRASARARGSGMDLAASAARVGRPDGLIARTDADSEPAPDWLRAQLDAVAAGAARDRRPGRASRAHDLPAAALRAPRGATRDAPRSASAPAAPGAREHQQFSGASIGVTAATYARVGRLEPRHALEDEGFERALRRHGVPIDRLAAVRVTTSGRLVGRAPRGLAVDLRRNALAGRAPLPRRGVPARPRCSSARTATVSVVLPTREVASTIGRRARRDRAAAARRSSTRCWWSTPTRATAPPRRRRHGARVGDEAAAADSARARQGRRDVARPGRHHRRPRRLPRHRHRGLHARASCSACSARCSTDAASPSSRAPSGARCASATRSHPDGGGRVTELLARPLLNLHVPELAGFRQPLAGEVAARARRCSSGSRSRSATASRSRC